MKKTVLIILSVIFLLAVGLFYYSTQGEEKVSDNQEQGTAEQAAKKDVREVVWEQLPTEQKESIDGSWKDAKVSKVTMSDSGVTTIEDASYLGKEVYVIDFPTKSVSSQNNILAFADINTLELIGYGLND